VSRETKEAALDALYAELPRLECKRLCQDSCTLLRMTGFELDRLAGFHHQHGPLADLLAFNRDQATVFLMGDPVSLDCPMLRDGLCSAYERRPLICRLWYCVEGNECPHGCVPEWWLTDDEAVAFYEGVQRIVAMP